MIGGCQGGLRHTRVARVGVPGEGDLHSAVWGKIAAEILGYEYGSRFQNPGQIDIEYMGGSINNHVLSRARLTLINIELAYEFIAS